MKKVYEVTIKRMVDGKPESWLVDVLAHDPNQAKRLAQRRMRHTKNFTCSWTVTRCRVVAEAAARDEPSLSWEGTY